MSPAIFFLLVGLVLLASLGLWWKRRERRVVRGREKVDAAWKTLEAALSKRVQALEEMHRALERVGYVPEARPRLKEAIQVLKEASQAGPRARAEADERVELVLTQIYRALPRERLEDIRQAQNRLAQADEDLDIVRNRYNELVFTWVALSRRFLYRSIVRRKRLTPPEPFLLPEEDEEFIHRRLLP